jgi:carbamoyltransferase
VNFVSYYEKPFIKFERLLETYLAHAPRGFRSFRTAMPVWLKEKIFLKSVLRKELTRVSDTAEVDQPELLFAAHHESHAASAFFPSPFEEAATVCIDGVGEWTTTSIWHGTGNSLRPISEIRFPHSLGLLYSAFTQYCGFKVNSGEYKLMGLAPYGNPRYTSEILENLIEVREDGSFRLNMVYFDYCVGDRMINDQFCDLFGAPPRKPESTIEQHYKDVAASVQKALEFVVVKICEHALAVTGERKLALAGGVALNCVANAELASAFGAENVWVQPAAGDAGGAIGSALVAHHRHLQKPRLQCQENISIDSMAGSLLGPAFDSKYIGEVLDHIGATYETLPEEAVNEFTAQALAKGAIVGWYQGRMEFGPRALGSRSILADPRGEDTQRHINLSIKYRESFRPFAPVVPEEVAGRYFAVSTPNPYMTFTAQTNDSNSLPAVTHVDGSARVQTVSAVTSPRLHGLLSTFHRQTGTPVLVNTSFNVRGEPIVLTPLDAYRCFMRTEMDLLILGNHLLRKDSQPEGLALPPRKAKESQEAQTPDVKEVRLFSFLMAAVIVVATWIWASTLTSLQIASGVSTLLVLVSLIAPRLLLTPMKIWMKIGYGLRKIINPLLLGALYFGVFAPFGAFLRLTGYDPMGRSAAPDSTTLYVDPDQPDADDDLYLTRPY